MNSRAKQKLHMNKQTKKLIVLLTLATSICVPAQAQSNHSTNSVASLDREPIGSKTSWLITTNSDNQIVLHMTNHTSGSNWITYGGPVLISLPGTFKDSDSGIVFFVESDGRHISAISPDGRILWHRQPALDGKLPPYSQTLPKPNPSIVWIGALNKSESERLKKTGSGKFIGISFNSKQAGVLDMENGDFIFQGQN